MMAEVAVEIPACKGCGADVRSESLFCYSCGAALNADADPAGAVIEKEPEAAADAASVGKANEKVPQAVTDSVSVAKANEKVPEVTTDAASVADANEKVPEAAVGTRPPLTSAASLRKKRRAFDRQPVRISWEPPDRQPTGFIVATIALTIAAGILLGLAFYLR